MDTYTPSLLSLPPFPHLTPHRLITEHGGELPVLYSSFPLAICFTHGSVYMLGFAGGASGKEPA